MQNTVYEYSPLQLSTLATPLDVRVLTVVYADVKPIQDMHFMKLT